ncbi:MAG: polymerase, sigma-24 subunit, subfamily protein [Frankiales bacterium]|nr:polymerase, sigma-24 subunit, subfamily protein [Frankiales bacterium]
MRDPAGFREFVVGGAPRHLRTAYLLTGNPADAEDLLQTALTKLMRVWDRVAAQGSPDAYLRTVIVNTHASRWQRKWRGEVATEVLPESGHDPYPVSDDRDQLRRALLTLTKGERAVVVLRHVEDLPEAEVARVLGCSPGTVKSQSSRGLAKLRAALSPELSEVNP